MTEPQIKIMNILKLPDPAGFIRIGDGFSVQIYTKPSRWQLFWMRKLLGWRWEDWK